ncbi:hypothetical protein PM082_009535 [Marasmius tenuissimus]|nr:hypothetical protein PM082_009535 [Marasmius tenuissimus]
MMMFNGERVLQNSLTSIVILIYRCYCVCNRSIKFIVLPILLMLPEIGLFYASFADIVKGSWGMAVLQDNGFSKAGMITSAGSLIANLSTNLVLTTTIAYKIWATARGLEAVSERNRRFYRHIMAVVIESGSILLIFMAVLIGLMLDNGYSKGNVPAIIVATLFPQVLAFVPLLISVRVGLGRTFEEETLRLVSTIHIVVPPGDSENGTDAEGSFELDIHRIDKVEGNGEVGRAI